MEELKIDKALLQSLVKSRNTSPFSLQPHTFKFIKESNALIFLAAVPKDANADTMPVSSLYAINLKSLANSTSASPTTTNGPISLSKWIPLVSTAEEMPQVRMSKEEELLRERQRMQSVGITSYHFHERSSRILVPASGKLGILPIVSDGNNGIIPQQLSSIVGPESETSFSTESGGAVFMDLKWSPDGRLVAFVRKHDLWVMDSVTGRERRLTRCEFADGHAEEEDIVDISNGEAEYIIQEEFSRYTGYWWCPEIVGSTDAKGTKTIEYRIMFMRVDSSMVPIVDIPQLTMEKGVDRFRYPRVGAPNARATPCTVRVPGCSAAGPTPGNRDSMDTDISDSDWAKWTLEGEVDESMICRKDIMSCSEFSWVEYIVYGGWIPIPDQYQERWFWLLLLDRQQRHLCVVAVKDDQVAQIRLKQNLVVLHEELVSSLWLNVRDCFHFEVDKLAAHQGLLKINMLYISEQTGYQHLYLKSIDLRNQKQSSPLAITSGSWMVEHVLSVCWKRKFVVFTGTKDSALERHIYGVFFVMLEPGVMSSTSSYSSSTPTRLTLPGFLHTGYAVHEGLEYFVANGSSLSQPPKSLIYKLDVSDKLVRSHVVAVLYDAHDYVARIERQVPWRFIPPEMFSFRTRDGDTIYGCIYKALGGNKPSPTLLHVYGGPHVQLVNNQFTLTNQSKFQLLARMGISTVMIDGRGSYRRGMAFESKLYENMGDIELEDQLDGLDYCANQGWIDSSRIAVSGWSYGGYMSLMALCKKPEVFKAAIAGAPVVRWEAYDTGYTERYMNLLTENEDGYAASSVLPHVQNIPDDDERLLLVHSFMDENVHAVHTAMLLDALIISNKPYRLLLFPKERHGIRSVSAQLHFERVFFDFLIPRLKHQV